MKLTRITLMPRFKVAALLILAGAFAVTQGSPTNARLR